MSPTGVPPTSPRVLVLALLCALPLAGHAQPPDGWSALKERLNAAIVGTGRLEVSSQPGGAKVLINGEWQGNTPTAPGTPLILTLPKGPYRIEAVIEASGLRASDEVYVAEGAVQPVQLRLSAAAAPDWLPESVNIPAGSFLMGSPDDEPERNSDEGPQHRVQVAAFALGKYEVTFAQWDACVADGGCQHEPEDKDWGRERRPVINVSWADAQEYVNWLSRKTGQTWRLPSEAEWEYAARAGTTTAFNTGDCIHTSQANYDGNYDYNDCGAKTGVYLQETQPVGSYAANRWGLHDMHGNVWEWTQDCWNASYNGAPGDGRAWTSGDCSRRVVRGGSWDDGPGFLRAAVRVRGFTGDRSYDLGFRVARTLNP